MKFNIDDLEIIFPYEYIYPEQYEYMKELKKTLDLGGHALLEMPSGTGKTITLLSLLRSYGLKYNRKVIYCSRTVSEIEKALVELQKLIEYSNTKEYIGIGLSSRKNMCIHEQVKRTLIVRFQKKRTERLLMQDVCQ
jgi:DNA excision repair protein ERCC-2